MDSDIRIWCLTVFIFMVIVMAFAVIERWNDITRFYRDILSDVFWHQVKRKKYLSGASILIKLGIPTCLVNELMMKDILEGEKYIYALLNIWKEREVKGLEDKIERDRINDNTVWGVSDMSIMLLAYRKEHKYKFADTWCLWCLRDIRNNQYDTLVHIYAMLHIDKDICKQENVIPQIVDYLNGITGAERIRKDEELQKIIEKFGLKSKKKREYVEGGELVSEIYGKR